MPKAKVNKVLAYRKCQQCRKDRQKCTPEGRSWPGTRCDRCQRYGYACSANRTKNEEIAPSNLRSFTRHDTESRARDSHTRSPFAMADDFTARLFNEPHLTNSPGAPHYSPELRPLPQGNAKHEARCLQKLGDCHQMLLMAQNLSFLHSIIYFNEESRIRELINECTEDITIQALTHQAQGRYKDAEYLYRQLEVTSAPLKSPHDSLLRPQPDMVLIYEKLGNLPAAETLQQYRLLFLKRPELGAEDAIISREAENLFRLYALFLGRLEDLNVISTSVALVTTFYRIAILNCSVLNALLFKSEVWTRYDHDLCLHVAIRIHSTEMIRGLISIGVEINKSNYHWGLPLLQAARYGDLDGLELLLDSNVDVGARSADLERTALHKAMYQDSEQKNEVIYRLIKAGLDVNARDLRGQTALQSAVFDGPEPGEKVVRCLIEVGMDIEAEDWNKETVLHLAVRRGYLATVQLLLQQGANNEGGGYLAEAPLFGAVKCAVKYADVSMAKLLLDHGANVEARNRTRNTPLHQAVIHRHIGMVEILLNRGASAAACNDLGQTPVDIARFNAREGGTCDQMLLDRLLLVLYSAQARYTARSPVVEISSEPDN